MFSPEGKVFKVLELIGNYCYLNILWLVSSLPLFTIFASTAAMAAVVKAWSNRDEPPITKTFFSNFKKYFFKSSLIGVLQTIVAIILIGDYFVVWNMEGAIKYGLFPIFVLLGLMFIFVSSYIYPLLIDLDLPVIQTIRKAVYLSVTRPTTPTITLMFTCFIIFICTFVKFLPFLCAFSIVSFVNYQLAMRTIRKAYQIAI
ncbi:YesL family protein [Neobacillus sp. NPDC058068]|uniref:YesL family protein n=1 Tax=Neobacillus sp. NPDC058068 TaxID=3346325 RepID=UPI0036D7B176